MRRPAGSGEPSRVRTRAAIRADRLDVPAGTLLLRRERIRLLNDVRIAVDRTLVVAELAPDLAGTDFR